MDENEEEVKLIQPVRIGNVEFGLRKTLGPKPQDYVDIFLWYPNPYYGTEDRYKKEGEWYTPNPKDGIYRIHESCFKHKESCYTLATLDIREEPDVRSCGLRPFDLKPKDRVDFEAIVRLAYEYTTDLWREQNNY